MGCLYPEFSKPMKHTSKPEVVVKKCIICGKEAKMKKNWVHCLRCWDEKYGRYNQWDRKFYIDD